MNFTLSILENKIIKLITAWKEYVNSPNDEFIKDDLVDFFINVSEFIWFVLFSSSSVSTIIRSCRIFLLIINTTRFSNQTEDKKEFRLPSVRLLKLIYDNIRGFIKQSNLLQQNRMETYYLLVLAEELGKEYRLPIEDLDSIFLDKNNKIKSYFNLMCLLFYIKDIKQYSDLKERIKNSIEEKFAKKKFPLHETELTLLLFDTISCPYIDRKFKENIMKNFEKTKAEKKEIIDGIVKYNLGFINWKKFSFAKELDYKRGQSVY